MYNNDKRYKPENTGLVIKNEEFKHFIERKKVYWNLPVMLNTERQKVGVASCVHSGHQHIADLLSLTLLSLNQVIPMMPSASGLKLQIDIQSEINVLLRGKNNVNYKMLFLKYYQICD